MKIVVVFTTLFAIILASKIEIKLQKQQQNLKQSSKELLEFQKSILRLFRNIQQPDYYDDQKQVAVNYDIEDNIDNYNRPQFVREFWDLNRLGFLPKDEIFTIFNEKHKREAIALFKILYYAKDLPTLYNTACWARLFMNEGVFVYSLSVALVHRPDTAMIDLPPIYEIFPHYFYNMDVILEAQRARQLFLEERGVPVNEERNIPQIEDPIIMPPRPRRPMEHETMFNMPMEPIPQEPFYRGMIPPQPLYSPWYNLLPERLRPMHMDSAYRLEMMKQEELRQQKLKQAKMAQEEMRQGKIDVQEMKNERMIPQDQNIMDMERFDGITIDANYSRPDMSVEDSLVNYLTEDVGFNAYYYYYNVYFPCWMPNEMINFQTERRGEQFYYMMQQLLARYYLERLSNGLGEVPVIDYSMPIRTGYYPMMAYPNGMRFPMRPKNLWIKMQRAMENTQYSNNYTNSYAFVQDYERRIKDAIDLGYVYTSTGKQIYLYNEHGFETLGNIIEGNPETPNARFYGCLQVFVRLLLGNAQPILLDREFVVAPSALEHFETSLRDPVFYQFFKRMVIYFQRYLNNIPSYSTRDLLMPGVKIEDVQIMEPLTTYFEYDYVDISNAVYNKEMKEDMKRVPIRVRQLRLNNKPYSYVMNVNSDNSYNAMVKVFLGPKYDELGRRLDITESRLNFVEIDKFLVELTPGMNRIQRSSLQNCYTKDRTTYREMYMRIMTNLNRSTLPEYEPRQPEWCLPQRLLLPKGRPDGQTYQMYFIVTRHMPSKHQSKYMSESMIEMPRMFDSHPLGYPLDRPIDENDFYVPNSFFKDVVITHMGKKM